jgi:hypothetical protein
VSWAGPKKISKPPPTHGVSVLPVAYWFFPLPDYEMMVLLDQTTSLASSSQCTAPRSSLPGAKRHMKPTARSRPNDIGDSKSRAFTAHFQGAEDEQPLDSGFARLGGDSVEYAQSVALQLSSRGSTSGGELGCISAICQGMTFM